jgi:dsRNA-specific ribonuclease
MILGDFILYTIGVNRTIERPDLQALCASKYPSSSESDIQAAVADLIQAGKIASFGTTMSLPGGSEPIPDEVSSRPFLPKAILAGGALALFAALFMDVSVPVPGREIRVSNTGLMNTRIVLAIAGAGLLIGGTIMIRKD